MKKIFLMSQLVCISVLFAPEPDEDRHLDDGTGSESNSSWSAYNSDDLQSETDSGYSDPFNPGEPGLGEAPFFTGLDNLNFYRWYEDYFHTYEIDDIEYFVRANTPNDSFILSEMDPDAEVSEVSIDVPGRLDSIFKTKNGRPVRIKCTTKRGMRFSEVPGTFRNMLYKGKNIQQDVVIELHRAYKSGYENHLPLDIIELQHEGDAFYLIFGIEEKGLKKKSSIKEPESIRIQLKLPSDCPECYMDKDFLNIYHRIYSPINQVMTQLLRKVSDFTTVQGYSQIPDILQKQSWWTKVQAAMRGLIEDGLEPTLYIPTYQHDALIQNSYALLPFKHEGNNVFVTERLYGAKYSLYIPGLDTDFTLLDLADKEIGRLKVNYKGESDTEFVYEITGRISRSMVADMFKDILLKLKDLESNHPLSLVRVRKEEDSRYLEVLVDTNAPRLQVKLGEDEANTKYLTEENISICHRLDAELKQILDPDVQATDIYVEVPEVLKEQPFWTDIQTSLSNIGNASMLMIQQTQRDALVDKVHELLPFTHWYDNWFKAKVVDNLNYQLCITDRTNLSDTFKLSDLKDKKINRLWVNAFAPAPGKFKRSSGNTEFQYDILKDIAGNEISDQFKTALQKARKLRDDAIGQLSKIESVEFPLAMVGVQEQLDKTFLNIVASDEGKKLNPKSTTSEGPWLGIEINVNDTMDKILTEEKLAKYRDVSGLISSKIHVLLKDVTEFNDKRGYVSVPEVLKKQPFWPEAEALLKQIGNNIYVQIPEYLRDALVEKGYELLPFTHWYDNWFETKVVDNLDYSLEITDRTNLSDTFRLSDLKDEKISRLSINAFAPAPGKFKQSSGNTEFRYMIHKIIPGNELSDQLKIASQKARKLRDDSIAQLNKIESVEFPLALVGIREESDKTYLTILASDEGKKLNPKSTTSEGPWLGIEMNNGDTVDKILTEEKLVKCRDVCELLRSKVHELLKDVTEFNDERGYVSVPEVLKKQSFWSEAEALLKQIGNNISAYISEYLRDALVDKGYDLLPFTHWYDNWFKTKVVDNLDYQLCITDRTNLSDTFRLSDLTNKKINCLSINSFAPAPGKFKQSSGNTEFRYNILKDIVGNQVSDQFKIASQKVRKLRDDSIAQLDKIKSVEFPLKMLGVEERPDKTYLKILASDEGKKLNPKSTTSEGPLLGIEINPNDTMDKILTADKLAKCRDVCELLRSKVNELLKGFTEFSDKDIYTSVPDVLKKQSFWPEVVTLANQIGNNISVEIPEYLRDALLAKFG